MTWTVSSLKTTSDTTHAMGNCDRIPAPYFPPISYKLIQILLLCQLTSRMEQAARPHLVILGI